MITRRTVLSLGLAMGLAALLPMGIPVGSGAAAIQAEAAERALSVFAAASLKGPLDRVAEAFRAETGEEVTISYASSSALARQIEAGAPADLFFSADVAWMDFLVGKGAVNEGAVVRLLGNRLALVSAADAPVTLSIGPGFGLAEALGPDGLLAMGDPKSVPAGAYAAEALTALGVYADVAGRTTNSDNVRIAAALVARGEARLGIVYETDAKAFSGLAIVGLFPADSHRPILYPVAPVTASTHPARDRLVTFLQSEAALSIFRAAGFSTLPGS